MTRGCNERDILVLYKLWRTTSLARDATLQTIYLKRAFRLEFADIPGPSFEETTKKLLKCGLIGQLPKKQGKKFYIEKTAKVKRYLRMHGKNVDTLKRG
jgi:hypothetical protein